MRLDNRIAFCEFHVELYLGQQIPRMHEDSRPYRCYEIRQGQNVAFVTMRPPVQGNIVQKRFRKDALIAKSTDVEISFPLAELLAAAILQ